MFASIDQVIEHPFEPGEVETLKVNVRCPECNVRWEIVRGWSNAPHRNGWKGAFINYFGFMQFGERGWPTPSVHRECRDPRHAPKDGQVWLSMEHPTWADDCPLRSVYYECSCGYSRKVNVARMTAAIVAAARESRKDVHAEIDF